jgi:hypothetical protein
MVMKKMKLNFLFITIFGMSAALYSCNNSASSVQQRTDDEINATVDSGATANTSAKRMVIKHRLDSLSRVIDNRIDSINHQMATADAKHRQELEKQRTDLEQSKFTVKQEQHKLSNTRDNDLNDFTKTANDAMDSMLKVLK